MKILIVGLLVGYVLFDVAKEYGDRKWLTSLCAAIPFVLCETVASDTGPSRLRGSIMPPSSPKPTVEVTPPVGPIGPLRNAPVRTDRWDI